MSWKKLADSGALQEKRTSAKEVDGVLGKARKCLKASSLLLNEGLQENAFKEAYDAMIMAARALIFSLGYKPRTAGAHTITIEFCALYFGADTKVLIDKFRRMKQKRNYLIYGSGLMVSATEAGNSMKSAKAFVKLVEVGIMNRRGQNKLI